MRQIGRTIDEWHDLRGSGDDEPSDKQQDRRPRSSATEGRGLVRTQAAHAV
ncbi:hypothetical protein ACFWWA_15575 [Streptomyces goshikiensis]|uniref:hypothetical protein n=1 Tax=Streptomyces goshikiensis TaxID=1942 RepID=UPI003659B947